MGVKKTVKIGNIAIGGGNKIAIQSMLNAPPHNEEQVKGQIDLLINEGCHIIRMAVESESDLGYIKNYVKYSKVPMVADIQYDYKLAILCSEFFDKIRFNPGNIGSEQRVRELVLACKHNNVPIRIGVNGGSLEKDILEKYGSGDKALAESALRHVALLEKNGFEDIVISVKSSSVTTTVGAYRILDKACGYPLHVGLTESGRGSYGLAKSSICIGSLLLDNIGDTIRVSLSAPPAEEVVAAKQILKALRLIPGCEIIACPTCSRCKYNLPAVLSKVEEGLKDCTKDIKVAVMGCVVNGIGEAKGADFCLAGGGSHAVLFKDGLRVADVPFKNAAEEFLHLILDKPLP